MSSTARFEALFRGADIDQAIFFVLANSLRHRCDTALKSFDAMY